jgi:VWFA-related protein
MRSFAAGSVAAVLAVAALVPASAQQGTTFKAGVNLLAVDALVVDRTGQPILGLTPADFVVKINNHVRKIVSADLVQHSSAALGAGTSPALNRAPAGGSAGPSPIIRTPGQVPENTRTFVVAIDELSFLADEIKPAVRAVQAFIRKLDPSDMVGVYIYPYAKPALDITHDHALAIAKLETAVGRRDRRPGFYNLTASDILDISAGDKEALLMAAQRECAKDIFFAQCMRQLESDAKSTAAAYEYEGARRVVATSELIYSLGALPGHKTLVVLSAGMLSSMRVGGHPDFRSYMVGLGEQAARANVQPYFIHMDNSFEELMSAANQSSGDPALRFRSALRDGGEWASGLERLAGESGGALLTWKNGSGELVFDRLLRETSAYYLLGVEPTPSDWDGRTLLVSVSTTVKGATVRALRQVIAR